MFSIVSLRDIVLRDDESLDPPLTYSFLLRRSLVLHIEPHPICTAAIDTMDQLTMIDLTLEDASTKGPDHSSAAMSLPRLRQTDIRDSFKAAKRTHQDPTTARKKRRRTNSSSAALDGGVTTSRGWTFTSHEDFNKRLKPWPENVRSSNSSTTKSFDRRQHPTPAQSITRAAEIKPKSRITSLTESLASSIDAGRASVDFLKHPISKVHAQTQTQTQHEPHAIEGKDEAIPPQLVALPGVLILESDDDEPPDYEEDTLSRGSSGHDSILLDDFMDNSQLNKYLKNLQIESAATERRASEQRREIPFHKVKGASCTSGKSVELVGGAFLRINKLLQNGKGEVFVSGHRLERENFQGAIMPVRRRNELVWIKHVQRTCDGSPEMFITSIDQVVKNREIVFTNQTFPTVSSSTDHNSFRDPTQDVKNGALFCRWKRTHMIDEKGHIVEEMIELLRPTEADDKPRKSKQGIIVATRISAKQQRFNWRQARTTLGGSHETNHESLDVHGQWHLSKQQQYTFGDSFCGAGGMSRGALDALLRLDWAFDNDPQAMDTYTANFVRHGAKCMQMSVDEFITWAQGRQALVDVLHMSPPCQPFSPAHTTPCDRDERNQACLFAPHQLLEFTKPRIATIEQTWGLKSFHRDWFNALICTFISIGYSIRWRVLRCDQYGVPQLRKRLFIIAAGPGEKLPPFAAPTHGNGPGLRPMTTIEDMIRHIPRDAENHDSNISFHDRRPKPAFDARTQAKTVTCHGGMNNWHPSGLRPYTVRELACLQTFPLCHTFSGARGRTAAKRQNGNAVPPIMARAIMREIIRCLKESDEAEVRGAPRIA